MNAENESKPTTEATPTEPAAEETSSPPIMPFDDLVERVFTAVVERFNDGLNTSIEEAKRVFAAEASADAEAKVKEISKAAVAIREEGSRRLATMQNEFKTELNKAKERVETEIKTALEGMKTTAERYKKHIDAAGTQMEGFKKRLDEGLTEVPKLREEVKALRDELATTNGKIDAAVKDANDAKNLATRFAGDIAKVKEGLGSLRRFVDVIAEKTGVRKSRDTVDPA